MRRAVVAGPEQAGWSFLGDLGGDVRLPQWGMRDSRRTVGLVVGGETGVRSVYVRLDRVGVGPNGEVEPVFVVVLEPRRPTPIAGWRSA